MQTIRHHVRRVFKGSCLVTIEEFSANTVLGGRYSPESQVENCTEGDAETFVLTSQPWLVDGIELETFLENGVRRRPECRDTRYPFGFPNTDVQRNSNWAQANPVLDGKTRNRTMQFLDGALIDQRTMFIIFREHTPSFLGDSDPDGFSAYGFLLLERAPDILDATEFEGNTVFAPTDQPDDLLATSCDQDLLNKIPETGGLLNEFTAINIATTLISGFSPDVTTPLVPLSIDNIHYLCEDSKLIDGVFRYADGTTDGNIGKIPCPAGSDVVYFGSSLTENEFRDNAQCSILDDTVTLVDTGIEGNGIDDQFLTSYASYVGTCGKSTLVNLGGSVRQDITWTCTDGSQFCDSNPLDLRDGKTFYRIDSDDPTPSQAVMSPLYSSVQDAFRYKTKFKNRTGTNLAFTPEVCIPTSSQRPYCYDPTQFAEIEQRLDCAIHIFNNNYDNLDAATRALLHRNLVQNFAFEVTNGQTYDGFERLYAELLIMLGDESYTQAFDSRFDLASSQVGVFVGSEFEPNGIDLSGVAGSEMANLYRATQYYQIAVDRFFSLSQQIWKSLNQSSSERVFIGQATITTYFDRLIRASVQKARAWAEISKRYQGLYRPDLARLVVERAYTSTYLESQILNRFMLEVVSVSDIATRDQIQKSV